MTNKPNAAELPKLLRQKSKGWHLVDGKYLSETPRMLCDAAAIIEIQSDKIERLEKRVKELEDAMIAIGEYWNGTPDAAHDAIQEVTAIAEAALAANQPKS